MLIFEQRGGKQDCYPLGHKRRGGREWAATGDGRGGQGISYVCQGREQVIGKSLEDMEGQIRSHYGMEGRGREGEVSTVYLREGEGKEW